MACVKILILLGVFTLGFLIPSSARDICSKSRPKFKGVPNPIVSMVVEDRLNYLNVRSSYLNMFFDVDHEDYLDFIKQMRYTLGHTETHGIPVLLPQSPETAENARWLDIVLSAGHDLITVRLEQSNLYVRGYQRTSVPSDQEFWELTDTELIPNRRDLRFSGSYSGSNSMGSLAGGREVPLGHSPLVNAVHTLARLDPSTGSNARDIARSLLVIVQMLAEGARFRAISEHIGENYCAGARLDSRMLALQNGWGQLSTAVMQGDLDPTDSTPLPNIPSDNPTQVYTFGQAFAVLGIMLITRPRGGESRSSPDYGRCLMNLEYVRVNYIENSEHRNNHVFGTVRADDGWYTYDLYRREKDEYEKVRPGEFATLTDSNQSFPVSGMDAVTINVSLFEGDRFSSSDEIAEGYILWDRLVESVAFANYDKHLQRVVKGKFGDVTVGYSVLSYALGVTVEVILVDGNDPSQIYGTVTASQVLAGSSGLAAITLLHTSSGDRVKVSRLQSIPLSRTVLAATTSAKLTISASLWDHHSFSLDDKIAFGDAAFTVRPGTQKIDIEGRHGKVQVVVTCA